MSKQTNKRCVSVPGWLHADIKEHASKHGVTISTVVEQALAHVLGYEPVPRFTKRHRGM